MESDGLPLAVGVGGQVDSIALAGLILEIFDGLGLAFDSHIFGLEVVFDIDTELGFWQILDMPPGRDNIVSLTQEFLQGLRFCRRLDNYQIFCQNNIP